MSQSKLRFYILLMIVKYRNNLENLLTQLFNYIYSLFGMACAKTWTGLWTVDYGLWTMDCGLWKKTGGGGVDPSLS